MDQLTVRAGAAALIAVLLVVLMTRASGAHRRRAFGFGAAAFAIFASLNALVTLGLTGWSLFAASFLGIACMAGSLVSLLLSYRSGEMDEQMRRAHDLMDRERRRYDDQGKK